MKVAIVTGASSGLGRAIAIQYAKQGWTVVCSDIREGTTSGTHMSTVDSITRLGTGKAIFHQADVSKSEDIQALVAIAVSHFGRLDIMVNNAGISLETNLGALFAEATDESTFDKTIAVNLRSVFLGSKYAIRQFLKQEPGPTGHRGWIINTASVYGLKPEIGHVSYCTAKAGVVHMTKCIAREYGPSKIHVNAICPGFVATPMDKVLHEDVDIKAGLVARHPWGELGSPGDIASAAVWLASEEAGWVTGVALPVDGGYMTA